MSTETDWNRTIALVEAELDKANADLEQARKQATWSDPFAPDYGDIVDSNTEQVKALREHRDKIGRDLKAAIRQRDRALGVKR